MTETTKTRSPRRVYAIRYCEDNQSWTEPLGRTTLDRAIRHAKAELAKSLQGLSTEFYDFEVLDARGETVADLRSVAIDPEEPDCTEARHDWQDDGAKGFGEVVRGNGGGVVCRWRCSHCRTTKTLDTWAQRRDTGEQGLNSVTYSREEA